MVQNNVIIEVHVGLVFSEKCSADFACRKEKGRRLAVHNKFASWHAYILGSWERPHLLPLLNWTLWLAASSVSTLPRKIHWAFFTTVVSREAWATLPESSSLPLPATLAQSRNLAPASLKTAVHPTNQMNHIGPKYYLQIVIPFLCGLIGTDNDEIMASLYVIFNWKVHKTIRANTMLEIMYQTLTVFF